MRTCCAHYPGGSERVHVSIASPFHAAFPKLWAGRHPHCPFRGLLRLHSRYGPHACSTAQGGLCHGASTGPVTQPRRPSATSSIDNSLGGSLLHRCFAPSRRTRVCGHWPCRCFIVPLEHGVWSAPPQLTEVATTSPSVEMLWGERRGDCIHRSLSR